VSPARRTAHPGVGRARVPPRQPDNGAGIEEKLDVSKVYFMPAGADVAASVGRAMGNILVTRMPVPVWITGGPARLGDATVVVMLGKDLAATNRSCDLTGDVRSHPRSGTPCRSP